MRRTKGINALVSITAMVCGLLVGTQVSMAATYPDRRVKLVVGFPPGSSASTLSTLIAKRISEFMELPMVVESDEVVKQNNYRRDEFRKITKSMGIYIPNR